MKASDANQDSLFQDLLWGEQRNAFNDPLGQSLLRAWKLGVKDPLVCQLLRDKLHRLKVREAMGDLPPFKAAQLGQGEVLLGDDLYGSATWLRAAGFLSGTLVVANTGAGKTTLLLQLAVQLARCCSVWLVECYKRYLRRLFRPLRRLGVNLVILRPEAWRWNLLECHLENPRHHLAMAVDLLMRLLDLPARARSILNQGVHDLYRQHGIWTGRVSEWPCLFDLYEWVHARPSLNAQAREALLDRLASLLVSLTPRCAAWRRGWNPADLARHAILFELGGVAETVKQALLESTLFSLFQRQVETGLFNGPLRLWICFDDSQRFFSEGGQGGDPSLTPMDELAGIVRGCGLGLAIMSQSTLGLSRRLLPNLANKFMGRLGSGADYAAMASDLGLNPAQVEYAKLHLQPGMFIGQVATSTWREPFLFTVPPQSPLPDVTETEVAESLKPLEALPTLAATEYAHWTPHHLVEVSTPPAPEPALDEAALRFLQAVIDHPGKPSSEYARLAGMSGARAAALRDDLVAQGFLRQHTVATGARGRSAIVLEPLALALDHLNHAGIPK